MCSGGVRSSCSTLDGTLKSLVCYINCQLIKSLGNVWWVRWIIISNKVFSCFFFFILKKIYFQVWKIGGCFWYWTTSNCHFHKKTSNTLKLLQVEPFYVIIDLCITFQIQKEVLHRISQSSQILDSFIDRKSVV